MVLDNKDRPMGPILFPMLILYSSLRKRSVSIWYPLIQEQLILSPWLLTVVYTCE